MLNGSTLRSLAGALTLVILAAAVPAGILAAPDADAAPETAQPVDINSADVNALVEIPGVGKATAERIVAWRTENGPFRSVEDLMKVKGIGEKSLEKIRPYVKVGKAK